MKSMGRLLLVALPVLAICTFLLVRTQLGGIAPASPESSAGDDEPAVTVITTPRTAQLEPTVLAPEPNTAGNSVPPGVEPQSLGPTIALSNDSPVKNEVIPIPDLQQPSTLLEFPAPPSE